MKKYYIYAHIRKDKNTIFYIGKGSGNRSYFKSNRSLFWKRVTDKYGYEVVILLDNLTEEKAYEAEILFIAAEKLKGNCEANFTNGGDGVRVDKRWWNDKIANSQRGKKRARGKENKNYKDIITGEGLIELYINQKKSTTEIAKSYGITYATIWNRLKSYNIPIRSAGRIRSKIICINDEKIHESLSSAARFYGVFRENIKKVLSGKYQHTNNLKFRYYE